jgi:antitoxin CptB
LSGTATAASRGQLAWHCRRGMKELDLLLLAYLDGRWAAAAADEKSRFEAFLELPDPVIAGYLLGDEQPPDAGTRSLVATLRGAAEKSA